MSTSCNSLTVAALQMIGIVGQGSALTAQDSATGLGIANRMLGSWSIQNLTIPVIDRQVFPLVANKGGTATPYTIGPGGDFNTTRPAELLGVGLLLNASTPPVEIPRGLLTEDAYQAIAIKDMPNSLFTDAYYSATYPLGQISLYPVPNTALNSLVIYRRTPLATFADAVTSYDFPAGTEDALVANLAVRWCPFKTMPVPPDVAAFAKSSLGIVKRSNSTFTDMPIDPMFTGDRRGGYNIQTGQ